MRKITKIRSVLKFLKAEIAKQEPKSKMPYGLTYTFEDVFAVYAESSFGRFATDEETVTYITAVYDYIRKTRKDRRVISQAAVDFVHAHCDRLVAEAGSLRFPELLDVIRSVLSLKSRDLFIGKGVLRASTRFEREHGVRILVRNKKWLR